MTVPAGTRVPSPTEATRRALADLDHIFDSTVEPEELPVGPNGYGARSNARMPEDGI